MNDEHELNGAREESSLTCPQLEAAIPAYARGALSAREARTVEWHAAHCRDCEVLLAASSTRVPADALARVITMPPRDVQTVRDKVLARVASRTQAPANPVASRSIASRSIARGWSRARIALATGPLAAALIAAIVTWRSDETSGRDVTRRETPTPAETEPFRGSAPMETAMRLASAHAVPEFAVLDAASQELAAALAGAPGDATLRAFQRTLAARRRELEARVSSVTE